MHLLKIATEKLEEFYEDLKNTVKRAKYGDIDFTMGDFNAKIDINHRSTAAGKYCLGNGNERGERLLEFAETHDFKICNTWFKHHHRRLYTWTSPGDRCRNQIDFILVNSRYKNTVKNCHTYPGADCNTDHKLLMAKCSIMLKKCKKTTKTKAWDFQSLKNQEVKMKFQKALDHEAEDENVEKTQRNNVDGTTIEEEWQRWKRGVTSAMDKTL